MQVSVFSLVNFSRECVELTRKVSVNRNLTILKTYRCLFVVDDTTKNLTLFYNFPFSCCLAQAAIQMHNVREGPAFVYLVSMETNQKLIYPVSY